eukprot:758496-Hanusia_phi.AAC.2
MPEQISHLASWTFNKQQAELVWMLLLHQCWSRSTARSHIPQPRMIDAAPGAAGASLGVWWRESRRGRRSEAPPGKRRQEDTLTVRCWVCRRMLHDVALHKVVTRHSG